MVQPVLIPELSALPGVRHGFFTRRGGDSEGVYASLNCGAGSRDSAEAVQENRARVARRLGAHRLVSAHQVHGTSAVVMHEESPDVRPKAGNVAGVVRGLLCQSAHPVRQEQDGSGQDRQPEPDGPRERVSGHASASIASA